MSPEKNPRRKAGENDSRRLAHILVRAQSNRYCEIGRVASVHASGNGPAVRPQWGPAPARPDAARMGRHLGLYDYENRGLTGLSRIFPGHRNVNSAKLVEWLIFSTSFVTSFVRSQLSNPSPGPSPSIRGRLDNEALAQVSYLPLGGNGEAIVSGGTGAIEKIFGVSLIA